MDFATDIHVAITGSSGHAFWGGGGRKCGAGERKICRKNHGAGRCLAKFSTR